VAQAQGFYAKENLDVQESILDPNIIVSSLIGGALEVGWADSTQLMIVEEKGSDLVAFGLSTYRQPYKLMSIPSVKTIADLKGRRIGIPSEIDVYTYVIKQILRSGKLDPDKDVEWIIGGNSSRRLAAIVGGAVDAGLFSPPADSRLKSEGYNTLAFTPDIYPNLTLSAETARRDWAEQNAEALRRLTRAQANAAKWLRDPANKARALEILLATTGGTTADAEDAYAYYANTDVWQHTCINRPGLANVVKIMHETGQLTKLTEADVPKFADPKFCAD
jgi:ABC-type nitrate/sulfonate/bicarbonate transport system substrate-binding protein